MLEVSLVLIGLASACLAAHRAITARDKWATDLFHYLEEGDDR